MKPLQIATPFRTVIAFAIVLRAAASAGEPDLALALFEKRIRPVLVERCSECHSAGKKVKGGLRLDDREGWEQGGDSGPAIVPGKPEESLLIAAIRHEGGLRMPPQGKLADAVIRDFEEWIRQGAVDPRRAGTAQPGPAAEIDIEAGRRHWSYRPLTRPALPDVRDQAWPQSDIDRFILARLEREFAKDDSRHDRGRFPRSPVQGAGADRETLLRRVYFDLVGLPPAPEEIDAFLGDESPEAWERVVERLLASPHFGERWGRHWLDVVRFAESITLRGFVFREAWRYRDYVIDAFDRDLPFDRFVREQIAGDLLPGGNLEERQRRLIATTMLMLGNTNLEEQDKRQLEMDVVDEQLDVIGRGFLAQTITCARCHDHKFDPIPTRDYYALAGILKNSQALEHENVSKWIERPLPLDPAEEAIHKRQGEELAAIESRIAEARAALKRAAGASAAGGPDVIAARDLPGIVIDDAEARRVGVWQHSRSVKRYIGDGYLHDGDEGKGEKTLSFDPELPVSGKYEVRLAYTSAENRADKVPVTVMSADGEKTIAVNEREVPPLDGRFVSLGQYRFERGGQSFVIVSTGGTQGHVVADAVQFLPLTGADASVAGSEPKKNPAAPAESDEERKLRAEMKRLEQELKARKSAGPKRPMVMTVRDTATPADLCVHVRGSVHNRGPEVPRGFLQVASTGDTPPIPPDAGGRLQLAEWIGSRDNPLTPRVIVNRVWHWLFGAGLVRTTDNFGTTGEAPSHPELLDHLAMTFIEEGWSIKRLVRRIVLSRTYRLAAIDESAARALDPENRLLWRANRRRLDAECLRDAMLCAAGGMQWERGGPTFPVELAADYGFIHDSARRSVYLPVFRNALPDIFEVFDFADPSLVTGRRNASTVAPQALFLLNHPFVLEQSRRAAERLWGENANDDVARLLRAYRLVLGRAPTDEERALSLEFVRSGSPESDAKDRWMQFVQSLFASLDFRYLD